MPLWAAIDGPAGDLAVHIASGSGGASAAHAGTLLLCHGFPGGGESAAQVGSTLPSLVDHLAEESGWRVVVGCFRGVGASTGDFSLGGWFEDLRVLVDYVTKLAGYDISLAGFGTGGALAICAAEQDVRIRGVACMGSPSKFTNWASELDVLAKSAREAGMLSGSLDSQELEIWGSACNDLQPLASAGALSPRPVLVMHGTEDDQVPVADAREMALAIGSSAELRLLQGAGHHLRADPRAVALLLGWLERHS